MMFDVESKLPRDIPVESVQISSFWVRGYLGEIKVWHSFDSHRNIFFDETQWTQVYEKTHDESIDSFTELELDTPLSLIAGRRYGIYIHSSSQGNGIVYDDERHPVTFENQFLRIYPGLSHTDHRPFNTVENGWTWRTNRAFVGKVSFGFRYVLWQPIRTIHQKFNPGFRAGVMGLLFCNKYQKELRLPKDVLLTLINMLRWDWFGPTSVELDFRDSRALPTSRVGWMSGGYRNKLMNHIAHYRRLRQAQDAQPVQRTVATQTNADEVDFDDDLSLF